MPTLLPLELELELLRDRSPVTLPVSPESIVIEAWGKLWPSGIPREDYPRAAEVASIARVRHSKGREAR
jgi:hypothetical protein